MSQAHSKNIMAMEIWLFAAKAAGIYSYSIIAGQVTDIMLV